VKKKARGRKGQRGKWPLLPECCFAFLDTDNILQRLFSALLFRFYLLLSNKPVVSPFITPSTNQEKHYRHFHVQDMHGLTFRKIFRKIRKIERFASDTCSRSLTFTFHLL